MSSIFRFNYFPICYIAWVGSDWRHKLWMHSCIHEAGVKDE